MDIFSQLFGAGGGGASAFSSMGGGGPGGRRSAGGPSFSQFGSGGMPGGMSMDMDDDDMSGFTSARGGQRQSQRAGGKPPTPTEVVRPLPVSLEDLYSGTTKRMKLTRKKLDGTSEEKVLTINVKPGWKAGTKIRFADSGTEEVKDGQVVAQTIVFVVEEKPHDRFKREGDNLIYTTKIPLVDALTGPPPSASPSKTVQTLDGRQVTFKIPYPDREKGGKAIKPGQEIVVPKEGFPSKTGKGNLVVRVEVTFPEKIQAANLSTLRDILPAS